MKLSKKLASILALIIFSGLSLTACSERSSLINNFNATLTQSLPLRINEDLKAIELTVTSDVQWDSTAISLRLVNNTQHEIIYGESFSIEFFDDDSWKMVQPPDDIDFITIGYRLAPGESSYLVRHLEWLFPNGLARTGRYRLRTHVFNDADIPIREHHLHDLGAEFYIE